MALIIYAVAQVTTMLASIGIKGNTYNKTYKKIGDKGYKISADKVEELLNDRPKERKIVQLVDALLFLIPFINVASAVIKRQYDIKKVNESIEKHEALIPMTEEEKLQYSKFNSTLKKATFVSCYDSFSKALDEIKVFIDDENTILKQHIAQLYYEKLPAISYTLEEVKKLSTSIDSSYKLGKIEGINTAIIGLPEDCYIDKVIMKKEDSLERYQYEIMDEENIETEKFIIYPFGVDFNENDKLKACYQKIVDERDKFRKNRKKETTIYNIYQNDDKPFVRVKQK